MRLQKSKKNRHVKNYQKWHGYYLSDVDCTYCQYFRGKKRGCPFNDCAYEDERLDAIANRRIIRPKVRT